MSLRIKVLVMLVMVLTAYAITQFGIMQLAIVPRLQNLEQMEAEKDVERCLETLNREMQYMITMNQDWSNWDAPYNYVKNPNSEFEAENLMPITFEILKIHLIVYVNSENKVIWSGTAGTIKGEKFNFLILLKVLCSAILN